MKQCGAIWSTWPSLWREWERLGGVLRPSGIVVQHMLDRFVPPVRQTDSRAESQLLQIVRAAGFPEPVPQYRVWLSPASWVDLDYRVARPARILRVRSRTSGTVIATSTCATRSADWNCGARLGRCIRHRRRARQPAPTLRWPRWPESSHASISHNSYGLSTHRPWGTWTGRSRATAPTARRRASQAKVRALGNRVGHSKTGGMS